ncbi:MAG: antitoxin family protein [Nostocaceae cyanobacterium]|nr:antitoxin family protein [Nostocaceae cyanobacterium]
MSEIFTAIYENGVLRPLNPLSLQEDQKVQIQILTEITPPATNNVLQAMINAGMLTLPRRTNREAPFSQEQRRELAQKMGQSSGKPLSEIIIEDRGEL